jgi:hypothetical protein
MQFQPERRVLLRHAVEDGGIRVLPEHDWLAIHDCEEGDDEGESGERTGFGAYVEALIGVIGYADRSEPLRD